MFSNSAMNPLIQIDNGNGDWVVRTKITPEFKSKVVLEAWKKIISNLMKDTWNRVGMGTYKPYRLGFFPFYVTALRAV